MAAFRYEALDTAGRTVSGVAQADTARRVRRQLRTQGLLQAVVEAVGAQRARAGNRAFLRTT